MAAYAGKMDDTANILKLPFGKSYELPTDFRFNEVPHMTWVRSYIYESVTDAIIKAIGDASISNKSRMQVKVNFPEGLLVV